MSKILRISWQGICMLLVFMLFVSNTLVQASTLVPRAATTEDPFSKQAVDLSEGVAYLIDINGTLWGWGTTYLAPEDSDIISPDNPQKIMENVVSVSAYSENGMAIKNDGSLWIWGLNNMGQFGLGNTKNYTQPIKLKENIKQVEFGAAVAYYIDQNDDLWGWTWLEHGYFYVSSHTPTLLMSGVSKVSSQDEVTLVLKTDGSVWGWGKNDYGTLGDGTKVDKSSPVKIMDGAIDIQTDRLHSYAIKADHSLWGWGATQFCGNCDGISPVVLHPVKLFENVKMVSSMQNKAFFIDGNDDLWGLGFNGNGGLGDGTRQNAQTPVKVMSNVKTVSTASGENTVAITKDGSYWGWGATWSAGYSVGDEQNQLTPKFILGGVKKINTNSMDTYVIKDDGSLWGWGYNGNYYLGTGDAVSRGMPVQILSDVDQVFGNFAVKKDGSLWGWGSAGSYIGNGEYLDQSTPVLILEHIKRFIPSYLFYGSPFGQRYAIGEDGTLWAWGQFGSTGNNVPNQQLSPKAILSDVVDMAIISDPNFENRIYVIKTDGSVWDFSLTYRNGTVEFRRYPSKVMDDAEEVIAGTGHIMVRKKDGSLWVWGRNIYYQLGDGTTTENYVPAKLMDDVKSMYTIVLEDNGYELNYAIKTDGSLWAWGIGASGMIGNGLKTDAPTPIKVMDHVEKLSLSVEAVAALKTDGSLWTWGDNGYGQLGDGPYIRMDYTGYQYANVRAKPKLIMYNVDDVVIGLRHMYVLKNDGQMFGWGSNYNAKLTSETNTKPRLLNSSCFFYAEVATTSWAKTENSLLSSFVINKYKTLYGWGDNAYGQLGDGTKTDRLSMISVLSNVSDVSAGVNHTLAFKTDKTLYAWGDNSKGQLGDNTNTSRINPTKILSDIIAMSAGKTHSLAVKSDGSLWAWGDNSVGQLGDGTTNSSLIPIKVMDNVIAVSAGYEHTLAITNDGSLWAWGSNAFGQLGTGNTVSSLVPVKIVDGVTAISAGAYHSIALTTEGKIYAWGRNSTGQIGNGTLEDVLNPVEIMSGAIAIDAAAFSSLALTTDKTLWTWGDNTSGDIPFENDEELPFSMALFANFPVAIAGNIKSMAAGGYHSSAVTSEGALMIWGRNTEGQLGIGNRVNTYIPTVMTTNKVNITVSSSTTSVSVPITKLQSRFFFSGEQNTIFEVKSDDHLDNLWVSTDGYFDVREEGTATVVVYDAGHSTVLGEFTVTSYLAPKTNIEGNNAEFSDSMYVVTENALNIMINNQAVSSQTASFFASPALLAFKPSLMNTILSMKTSPRLASKGAQTKLASEGAYTLSFKDLGGMTYYKNFVIAKPGPRVFGVTDGTAYNIDVNVSFRGGTATLNGSAFLSGSWIKDSGEYVLVVKDAQNKYPKTFNFIIDKIPPVITIDAYNIKPTNKDITVIASASEGTLNETSVTFTENGSFEFIAIDSAGNTSSLVVTITNIDKTLKDPFPLYGYVLIGIGAIGIGIGSSMFFRKKRQNLKQTA